MSQQPDINEYLSALKRSRKFSQQIVCHRILPARKAAFKAPENGLHGALSAGLREQGIKALYTHQADSIDIIRSGRDIVVASPTASGKSMIYNICVLESYLKDASTHALYLFPLKALAQDQQGVLDRFVASIDSGQLNPERTFSAIYDGDTKPYQRAKLRKNPPSVLISNPEMVHLSLLPYHDNGVIFSGT